MIYSDVFTVNPVVGGGSVGVREPAGDGHEGDGAQGQKLSGRQQERGLLFVNNIILVYLAL